MPVRGPVVMTIRSAAFLLLSKSFAAIALPPMYLHLSSSDHGKTEVSCVPRSNNMTLSMYAE